MILASCYSEKAYIGDGQLIDEGFRTTGGRYSVDLGEVRLSEVGKYEFEFSNLPANYVFTAGIQFDENIVVVENNNTLVSFSLISGNEEVFFVRSNITNWVLSHAPSEDGVYAYMRGNNDYSSTDCVWGTYFHPKKNQSYRLIVEIRPSSENDISTANVRIRDAGQSSECT